jgi:signal transduction histidine kinase
VTVVKVQAQLLRRRADEKLWSSIDQIDRAATRMARWIDELLEVATVHHAGELDLMLQSADLVKIARETIDVHQAGARRHQLNLDVDQLEIIGQFDSPRIERVIDNLVGNAIKYSPTGGCVSVSLAQHDGWATVVVRDQGVGIPAEDMAHVFEPFRRGANVVGRFTGTGIGLSSAQRIIQRHGGTLSVESEPDNGSTFTIRLPLSGPRYSDPPG